MQPRTSGNDNDVNRQPIPSSALRARTLEIVWHCSERNDEAALLGIQSSSIEGITSVDYCTKTGRLITTGGDGRLRMWRLHESAISTWLNKPAVLPGDARPSSGLSAKQGELLTACTEHISTMSVPWMPLLARWSPQGDLVASGHCEGKVCLWWRERGSKDNNSGEEVWKDYRHLSGHLNDVYDLCFSPDSQYLLSCSSDGSIAIHDVEHSTIPVVMNQDAHSKFCRGVAWDPWNRLLHTFGCGPALQCFSIIPKRDHSQHRRMHLANQRRCQGEFIGDTCSLAFRRPSWSPDGLLLAVPFGKAPQSASSAADAALIGPSSDAGPPPDGEMLHCINIYGRGAPDKLAARLVMRGYSEIRGVQWAPCFLTPLSTSAAFPLVMDAQGSRSSSSPSTAGRNASGMEEEVPVAAGEVVEPRHEEISTSESWGPADYRMALAAWTPDSVIVFTTDSASRHSDFTDLHMRCITDVAWNKDATMLFTASLDGYISVLCFGDSLSVAHQLPTFSTSPLTHRVVQVLSGLDELSKAVEAKRCAKAEAHAAADAAPAVAVVKKKKKLEGAPVEVMELDQLATLLEEGTM